jgi:hypothetical protein
MDGLKRDTITINEGYAIRISVAVKKEDVPKFSHLMELQSQDSPPRVLSWGERVHKGSTTFFVTFPDGLSVWEVSKLWTIIVNGDNL